MKIAESLREAQAARFAALDPMLPAVAPAPEGDVLTAALPDGRRVAATLVRARNGPGSLTSLWSAEDVWELFPLVGGAGAAGVEALLRTWREWMSRLGPPGRDSACVLTWPSRDAETARVLLDHGLMPLSVLAVRPVPAADPPAPEPGVIVIRRAVPDDLVAATEAALAEMAYSALLGSTVLRPDAADLKRAALGFRISQGDPVWVAEHDGAIVGLAECWLTEADPGTGIRFPVPPGRWGYVNTVSVLPAWRGRGVGRRLMAVAHRELRRAGVVGTYLYYNPPNPLSSVFWHRQGYRPLWSVWEVRPADALR